MALADKAGESTLGSRLLKPSTSNDAELTPTRNWASDSEIKAGSRKSTAEPEPEPEQVILDQANAPPPKAKKANVEAIRSPVRKAKKKTTEAWWWENVGNAPVDAFRDCLTASAAVQAVRDGGLGHDEIFRNAKETQCQPQYGEMEKVLAEGLGQERYRTVIEELARTTFMPAAVAEIDRARTEARRKAGIAADEPLDVAAAKQAMFSCFSREADALAVQDPAEPALLAREVVARCDEVTRAFFAALFVVYPVDPKAHEASIRIAVDQNYLPAIVSRISIVRQNQTPATSEQPSGEIAGSTVVTKQ